MKKNIKKLILSAFCLLLTMCMTPILSIAANTSEVALDNAREATIEQMADDILSPLIKKNNDEYSIDFKNISRLINSITKKYPIIKRNKLVECIKKIIVHTTKEKTSVDISSFEKSLNIKEESIEKIDKIELTVTTQSSDASELTSKIDKKGSFLSLAYYEPCSFVDKNFDHVVTVAAMFNWEKNSAIGMDMLTVSATAKNNLAWVGGKFYEANVVGSDYISIIGTSLSDFKNKIENSGSGLKLWYGNKPVYENNVKTKDIYYMTVKFPHKYLKNGNVICFCAGFAVKSGCSYGLCSEYAHINVNMSDDDKELANTVLFMVGTGASIACGCVGGVAGIVLGGGISLVCGGTSFLISKLGTGAFCAAHGYNAKIGTGIVSGYEGVEIK